MKIKFKSKFFFIFLLLFIINESNEYSSTDLNNQLIDNNTILSYVKKYHQNFSHFPKDLKLINTKSNKRIIDQKINERNQLCSNLKHEKCINLPPECLECNFNLTCVYGTKIETTCKSFKNYTCEGPTEFKKEYTCAYCYQLPESNYTCNRATTCKPYSRYLTNCTVDKKVLCLGNRKFNKFVKCQMKSNIKWNYALIFSITLGGFGIDRFYLGNWQLGFGKLFSFGGLGFWTLIDIILISVGYLKPTDGGYS